MAKTARTFFGTKPARELQLTRLFGAITSLGLLTSCHGSFDTENLSQVKYAEKQPYQEKSAPSSDPASGSQISYEANIGKEQAVADGCLKAWRKAVNDKDEAGAMKMLEELDKKYSGISSVQFMMGQVKDHFGKHKEAVEHFRRAHSVNEFSSMQTFKLAESMRKAGDSKGSIVFYQKLLTNLERSTGDYGMDHMSQLLASVRLGLASAYKDCNQNAEARAEVEKILKTDANNEKAKSLLKELENTGK